MIDMNNKLYTFTAQNTFGRLDRFYISQNKTELVDRLKVIPFARSDHDVISLKLNINMTETTDYIWKLNISLLDDNDCIQHISNMWQYWQSKKDFLTEDTNDLFNWWDEGKIMLEAEFIKYSIQKARQKGN